MNSTFTAISGYYLDDISETSGPLAEKVTEGLVAPKFLDIMGVSACARPRFTPEEMHFRRAEGSRHQLPLLAEPLSAAIEPRLARSSA